MWVLGIKLRPAALVASTFAYWAISLALTWNVKIHWCDGRKAEVPQQIGLAENEDSKWHFKSLKNPYQGGGNALYPTFTSGAWKAWDLGSVCLILRRALSEMTFSYLCGMYFSRISPSSSFVSPLLIPFLFLSSSLLIPRHMSLSIYLSTF